MSVAQAFSTSVRGRADLLVIEFPYFRRSLKPDDSERELKYFTARREKCTDPWSIETQTETRRDSIYGGESGSVTGIERVVADNDQGIITKFKEFRALCLDQGMTEIPRTKSSYTNGLRIADAQTFLDIPSEELSTLGL